MQVSEHNEKWRCNGTSRHEGNSIIEVRKSIRFEILVQFQFTFCHSRVFQRWHRLMVRTSGFQPADRSSILRASTNFMEV